MSPTFEEDLDLGVFKSALWLSVFDTAFRLGFIGDIFVAPNSLLLFLFCFVFVFWCDFRFCLPVSFLSFFQIRTFWPNDSQPVIF